MTVCLEMKMTYTGKEGKQRLKNEKSQGAGGREGAVKEEQELRGGGAANREGEREELRGRRS